MALATAARMVANVKRLVDVVAGPQPQRLPHGVGGLEGGHHDHLDVGIDVFEPFEHLDARHARHANIQNGHINLVVLGQLDGGGAVGGHQHLVFVLEDDPQRLPRTFLVIHDQERALAAEWFGRFRRRHDIIRWRERRHRPQSVRQLRRNN